MEQKSEKLLLEEGKREADFFDKEYVEADRRHSLEGYRIPERVIQQVLNPATPHLIWREYAVSLGNLGGKKFLTTVRVTDGMQSALHRLKQGYGQLISRKRVLSLPKRRRQ